MKKTMLMLAAILMMATALFADEGMWLFNQAPISKIKTKYGFEPTPQWLDHLRLGSVRFNNGGSGSFVSEDGLTFTNHHVGRTCLQQLSSKDHDFIKTGFYAATQAEEGKCPDLELNVLVGIENVTAQVQAAEQPGMTPAEAGKAHREILSKLESECTQSSGLRCDVVSFFTGGAYHLYKYKKYTDVRVVFAPEEQMAFFGGDHDNFEFPRYDLDICFFRIYENGKPVHLDNFLKWSKTGVAAGELVFVSGHPGGTERQLPVSSLEYLRDVQTQMSIDYLTHLDKLLHEFSAKSPEDARIAATTIFGIENSLKVYLGRRDGLNDPSLMNAKKAEESALRKAIDADPKLKAEYGDAWQKIEAVNVIRKELAKPYSYIEGGRGISGDMASYAKMLVRVTAEKQKPSAARLRGYEDTRLPGIEQRIFSVAPIYKDYNKLLLADSLTQMQKALGAEDPIVKTALGGKTPEEAANFYIDNSKLNDAAYRKKLYEGGAEAVAASGDPLINLMLAIDPEARKLMKRMQDEVDAPMTQNSTRLAKARFAVQGTGNYPDATFTLRLSYGTVKGFKEDGRGDVAPKGAWVPPFTTIGEAFPYAKAHGNKGDYELPESWLKAKAKLNPLTHFNFVSTADIIGGNSGSPTVNKKGEVVGIIFDGNIQSLPGDFFYEDTYNRAVSVDSRAIIEALRKVYRANALASELLNSKAGVVEPVKAKTK